VQVTTADKITGQSALAKLVQQAVVLSARLLFLFAGLFAVDILTT